jgi:hypothetical protein
MPAPTTPHGVQLHVRAASSVAGASLARPRRRTDARLRRDKTLLVQVLPDATCFSHARATKHLR